MTKKAIASDDRENPKIGDRHERTMGERAKKYRDVRENVSILLFEPIAPCFY
ncbi:MAG: hypothetical protein AB4290_18845 [Spirulina sp.]